MNLRNIKLSLGASVLVVMVSACADDPNSLLGKKGAGGPNEGDNPNGENGTPESLQCTAKPEGRAYVNFNGNHLEESRVNENVGVNRARIKPYAVMANEYQRVLGLVPEAIKTAGGSFDDPPERWYAESTHSGVSMNTIFEISFAGCLAYAKGAADLKAAPTADSAKAECTRLMRKAWNRSPSPEEIQGCTDLAMTKLASQTDVSRRWAYVCSSVLSSSQFLTF
jgi:hypothetical protein